MSHTVQETRREPGRSHHVHDDEVCVVLCVVLVIELLPMHVVFDPSLIVLDATLYDNEESFEDLKWRLLQLLRKKVLVYESFGRFCTI